MWFQQNGAPLYFSVDGRENNFFPERMIRQGIYKIQKYAI